MTMVLSRVRHLRVTWRKSLRLAALVLGMPGLSMPALAMNGGLLPFHPRVADAQLLVPEPRAVTSPPPPVADASVVPEVPRVAVAEAPAVAPEPEATTAASVSGPAAPASASAPASGALPFDSVVRRAAEVASVDAALLHAIIDVESGYDPQALSGKGAIGLMQVLPRTGERFGVRRLEDPAENVRAGASYVRWLLSRFDGDLPLVLAAYNAGEGAVLRYGRQIPPFPETQSYVRKVMAGYSRLRDTDAPGVLAPSRNVTTPGGSAPRQAVRSIATTVPTLAQPQPAPKAARAASPAQAAKTEEATTAGAWRLLRGLGTLLTHSPSAEAAGGRGRDQPAVLMP
jgi:soluble lytic murein transglycosylase-like protein